MDYSQTGEGGSVGLEQIKYLPTRQLQKENKGYQDGVHAMCI